MRRHLEGGVPLTRLAEDSNIAERALRRWLAAYRGRPLAETLQREKRGDRDARRMPADLVAVIEGLALQPSSADYSVRAPPSHRRRAHPRVPKPSYSTVRSIIAAIDPGLRTLALDGDAAYRDRCELVFRRTADGPDDQWQCDHTLLDLAVLDAKQRPNRPWLTVVLDDYSRALAGYTVFVRAPTVDSADACASRRP